MSDNVGFLIINPATGHLVEGKNRATKIFDTFPEARQAKPVVGGWNPVRLAYRDLAKSLANGTAFCFTTPEGHARFLRRLRNDLPNKPFLALSQDKDYVRWRVDTKGRVAVPAPSSSSPAKSNFVTSQGPPHPVSAAPPAEPLAFNPAILVPEGNALK